MGAVLVGHFEPGSPEWHAARANGLGGSEIAPILGLSPFESRFSLWHRKAGLVGHVEETPEMEWGKRLEPAIVGKFADTHPELGVIRPAGTWCHPDRPWQIGNPDGLVDDDAVVEAKFSLYGDGWGEDGTDEVPVHVRIQALWYLDTLGRQRAHVICLIGGFDYREYVVEYEPDEAAMLRAAAKDFLAEVAAGVRPDIDDHTSTYQVIKEMHPDIDGTEVELPAAVAEAYITAKQAETAATNVARKATALVADEMGNAQRATCDGRTIATRRARDGGVPFVVIARGLIDSSNATERPLAGVGAAATPGPWVDPEGGPTF